MNTKKNKKEWNWRWHCPKADKLWNTIALWEKKNPGYSAIVEHYYRGFYYFTINDEPLAPFRTQLSAIRFFKTYVPGKVA